ncbi:MAG: transglycosylase domain-containing protein [Steroidobacteraceae bacterium]
MAATAWIITARQLPVPAFETVRAAWRPSAACLVDRHGRSPAARRIDFGAAPAVGAARVDLPALLSAVIDAEDRRFYEHHGVDLRALPGALYSRLLKSYRARGEHALSMQLATLLEPPARQHPLGGLAAQMAAGGAGAGAPGALEQAARWKPTSASCSSAARCRGSALPRQVLAGREPAGLDAAQGELLAAFLPEPGAPLGRVLARACARAFQHGRTSCGQIRDAARARAGWCGPGNPPRCAGAAARRAPAHPRRENACASTLDARIQRMARDILRSRLARTCRSWRARRRGAGGRQCSEEVLACVGSARPASRSPAVDGVRAPRQAGSTLKPFLYELAIERRWLGGLAPRGCAAHARHRRRHLPAAGLRSPSSRAWSACAPRWRGRSTCRPCAPRKCSPVSSRSGPGCSRWDTRGTTEDGEACRYSLALGSAEVTLWQQAQGYRTLARGGRGSPLRLLADEPAPTGPGLLAAPAAFIVGDILSDPAARALSFGLDNHLNTPFWSAARAGTSEDMRDNWCVGFSHDYTVAVWVGNFEGDPCTRSVSGVTGAAPAWHGILVALQREQASRRPSPPAGGHRRHRALRPARSRAARVVPRGLATRRGEGGGGHVEDRVADLAGQWHDHRAGPGHPPRAQAVQFEAQGAGAAMRRSQARRDDAGPGGGPALLDGARFGARSSRCWTPPAARWIASGSRCAGICTPNRDEGPAR